MIKKISQLNRLPKQIYTDQSKLSGDMLLFEVSHKTYDDVLNKSVADEKPSYYTSYSTTLSNLGDMLELNDLKTQLSSIVSGGLSVIPGSLTLGIKGDAETQDRVEQSYYPDRNSHLVSYIDVNLQNDLKVHGKTSFQNDVVISSTVSNDNAHPVLLVNGVATFNHLINGTAFRAQWADLAEIYDADAEYEAGTLVKFGGEREITIATDKVNAVVSTKPAIVLNANDNAKEMVHPTEIALVGRVPITVRGPVKKFDKIVLSKTDPGIGVVYNHAFISEVIARALEDNADRGNKLVMCSTKFNIA